MPLADGTLVKAPVDEESALLPSLLTLSDDLEAVPEGYRAMDDREALKVLVQP